MARDVVERCRAALLTAENAPVEWPINIRIEQQDLADLLAVVEAAEEVVRREARSEYTSIYAAPSEFARILKGALASLYAGSSGESD